MKKFIPILLFIALIIACDANSITDTYKVKFDTAGGTDVEEQIIRKGNTATKPKDPIKAGTAGFKAWMLDGEVYDFKAPVTKDITLVATYIEIYTVSFDSDGGSEVLSQTVIEDKLAIEPKDPYKPGYGFSYWILNDEHFDFDTPITGDLVLKAKYYEVGAFHTVQFDSMGGSPEAETQYIDEGAYASAPASPQNDTKWGFRAWATRSGEEGSYTYKAFDFLKTAIFEDLVLYAWYWEKYTVAFDTDGGTEVKSQELKENTIAVEPASPTKENAIFKEWQLDEVKYNFNEPVTRSITLKAVYDNVYTVTFDSDGGTEVKSQGLKENTIAVEPASPTKENAIFKEWQLDEVKYNFNEPVTKSITLKAVYDNVYTVTFDSDGGTSINSQSVKDGEYATVPLNPEKANTKGFKYWSYQVNGKSQIFDFSKPITSDITLKANYWPDLNNQTSTGGEISDSDIQALKNEVRSLFSIVKDIKETDNLMNGVADIKTAFNIDSSSHSNTVLDIFANLGFNSSKILDDKGNEYKIGDDKFYYEIKVDESSINSNKSQKKVVSSDFNITEYDITLEDVKLNLYLRMNTGSPYSTTLTRTFDIDATVFDYGSGAIEVSLKIKIGDTSYPMLYGTYEKTVTHGAYSDEHFYFTYKGYTGSIII